MWQELSQKSYLAWLTIKKDKENQPQKTTNNRPKIDQKSFQNRFKIDPKTVQDRSKIGPGTDIASETLFRPILVAFWAQLGPSWGPKSGHEGAMLAKKSVQEGIRKPI